MSLNVLFVGETNIVYLTEHKGLDSFTQTRYTEYASVFGKSLIEAGHRFTHIPCHLVQTDFPGTIEALRAYDVVILSDVGANTMLQRPDSFAPSTNNLKLIRDFVAGGGGFVMIGGYLSFAGIEGKARYHLTPIEDLLPVEIQPHDDRVEAPEGIEVTLSPAPHPVLTGLLDDIPHVFGYNRVTLKPGAEIIAQTALGDPLIVLGGYGNGRAIAYATDCVQDWASPELLAWGHYSRLWDRLLQWVARQL
ncbi:MAG: cytoplasmic protein [Devosia sp.]|nr:cytoplasmic protein [Devosia sp.]